MQNSALGIKILILRNSIYSNLFKCILFKSVCGIADIIITVCWLLLQIMALLSANSFTGYNINMVQSCR